MQHTIQFQYPQIVNTCIHLPQWSSFYFRLEAEFLQIRQPFLAFVIIATIIIIIVIVKVIVIVIVIVTVTVIVIVIVIVKIIIIITF